MQFAQTALIALAACRNPLARPFCFSGNAPVHLVKHHRLVCQNTFRPVIKLRKIPVAAAQPALMQPDDAGAQIAQKGAVMADHQQGPAMLAQHLLHPFDGGHVHMVGRLVQQQDVGLGIDRACQRDAACLAAGQAIAHPVWIKPQTHQKFIGLVQRGRAFSAVGVMAHCDKGTQCHAARQIGCLRQIGNAGAGCHPQAALIHIGAAGHQLHQAGFASPVAPDKRQPVTGMQGQVGIAQQPLVAQIDPAFGDGQKRRRHQLPARPRARAITS